MFYLLFLLQGKGGNDPHDDAMWTPEEYRVDIGPLHYYDPTDCNKRGENYSVRMFNQAFAFVAIYLER